MPYKSDAQRKKFHSLLAEGKISQKIVDEFDKASSGMKLPEHAPKKSSSAGLITPVKNLTALKALAAKRVK